MPYNTLMDDGIEPLAVANSGNFVVDSIRATSNKVKSIFSRGKNRKRRKNVKHSSSNSRSKHKKRRSHSKRKSSSRSHSGIKYTKRGQPYILDKKTGKAKFIKRSN